MPTIPLFVKLTVFGDRRFLRLRRYPATAMRDPTDRGARPYALNETPLSAASIRKKRKTR